MVPQDRKTYWTFAALIFFAFAQDWTNYWDMLRSKIPITNALQMCGALDDDMCVFKNMPCDKHMCSIPLVENKNISKFQSFKHFTYVRSFE